MEDNLAEQIDELEVLTSIFGDQWKKCNKIQDSYSIKVTKDVELWITLNELYPSDKPPSYELWAPNLTRSQKDMVDREFNKIYRTDKGCPIIFQWIEKLKEIADGVNDDFTKLGDDNNSVVNADDFQPDNLSNQQFSKTCRMPHPIDELEITHGPTITDRKSTFQGHVCKIQESGKIRDLLENLLKNRKIREAKHNILAYRIVTNKNIILQDCDDDGETHAGGRLLHLLEILDLKNVAVVVTRWYGGIHLGPDRFKHINNAGRQALVAAGFIK